MNYVEAYEKTTEELRSLLSNVTNRESAQSFVEESVWRINAVEEATPEFYTGEFYHRFHSAIRADVKTLVAGYESDTEQILSDARHTASDLNRRLAAARAADDQALEHSVWREGEQSRVENQAAVDALTHQLTRELWRLRAVDDLGVTLCGNRGPTDRCSEIAMPETPENWSRNGGNCGMGPIETSVRNKIEKGTVLLTPTGRGKFTVAELGTKGPLLLLGRREARTWIPWRALEDVPEFLGARPWTEIGGVYNQAVDSATLDWHMKRFVNRTTAGWVASLLEAAEVIEINRVEPAKVRMRSDFSSSTNSHESAS